VPRTKKQKQQNGTTPVATPTETQQLVNAAVVSVSADPVALETVVNGLAESICGLSAQQWSALTLAQYQDAVDGELAPSDRNHAFLALVEARKVDVAAKKSILDVLAALAAEKNGNGQKTIPEAQPADLIAGLFALVGGDDSTGAAAESEDPGPGRTGVERRPTGTDVVVTMDDA
jgi:hypothetical protein